MEDGAVFSGYQYPSKGVAEYGYIAMIALKVTGRSFSNTVIKRRMDIVGSIAGLIILGPIIAITIIPLKLESSGSLFSNRGVWA